MSKWINRIKAKAAVAAASKAETSTGVKPLTLAAASTKTPTGSKPSIEDRLQALKDAKLGYHILRIVKGPPRWSEKKQKRVRKKYIRAGHCKFGGLSDLICICGPADENGVHHIPATAKALNITQESIYGWCRKKKIPKDGIRRLFELARGRVPATAFLPYS